jgi:hypothetical protein
LSISLRDSLVVLLVTTWVKLNGNWVYGGWVGMSL